MMLAIKGIFDGKRVKLIENEMPAEPQEVIVTFLGSNAEKIHNEVYSLAKVGRSFNFLEDEEELYSDKDLKVRYS